MDDNFIRYYRKSYFSRLETKNQEYNNKKI